MKIKAIAGAAGIMALLALAGVGQQSSRVEVTHQGRIPVYHIDVVARTITAINYRIKGGETKVGFKGTPLEPLAHGHAEVRMSNGAVHIKARFHHMVPAEKFGPAYTTYVLWAITPEGRPVNLGEVELYGNDAKLNAATNLQEFGLVVTAEPYFAVTRPSNLVVLQNFMRANTKGEAGVVRARYQLLRRSNYLRMAPAGSLTAIPMSLKVPLDYYEAENALRIARWAQAPRYAPGAWRQAQAKFEQAQAYLQRRAGKKPIAMMARAATQAAEDARLLSLKRQAIQETERRTARRQAAMQTAQTAAARAARRRDAAQAEAVASRSMARRARERAAAARAQTARAQQQAQLAQQQAQAAQQQSALAEQQQAAMRARLLQQLNVILQTRDTARGLIMNMPNLLFAINSYQLRTPAQIKLAKVAGVLATYPGLHVTVNGYTDSTGTAGYNLQLSQHRADAVRDFLVSQGVGPAMATATGYGESNPIASNQTDQGRQQNRRVELVVSGAAIGAQTAPATTPEPLTAPEPASQP